VRRPEAEDLRLSALVAAALGAALLSLALLPGTAAAVEDGFVWLKQSERRVRRVVPSPNYAQDRALLAGVASGDEGGYGVLRSVDGGATWQPANAGLDERMRVLYVGAASGPTASGTLVLSVIRRTYGKDEKPAGIFVSSDGGATWTARNAQSEAWDLLAAAISPAFAGDGLMLLGMRATGLLRSEDGGRTLTPANRGLTTLYPYGLAFTPTFAQDGTAFAATEGGGLFVSTDRGVSWRESNKGLDESYLYSVAVSPGYAQDRTVAVGTGQGSVYVSTDGGASWTGSGKGIRDQRLTTLTFSPDYATNRTLYVGSESGGLFRSTDAGASWSRIDAPFGAEVFSILPLPGPDGETLIVTPSDGGIWVWSRPGANAALAATATARAALPTATPRPLPTPLAAASGESGGGQCIAYVVVGPIGWLLTASCALTLWARRRTEGGATARSEA
jgi:photosystem II stability/assembly factor-like uncharacterized protein